MAAELTCPGPLSTRLNYLFDQIRDPDTGNRFSTRYVSQAINSKAGRQVVSEGNLYYMRRSQRNSRPKRRALQGIADFFNVPVEYFDDPATVERVTGNIDVLAAVKDPRVYNITIKAAGQHPKVLDAIDQILDQASAANGALPTHLTAEVVPIVAPAPQADSVDWHKAPFDQIRCNDLRLIKVIGGGWLFELGDTTIADAVNQDHTVGTRLDRHSAALSSWASRVAAATLEEITSELLDVWQHYKPPLRDRSGNYPNPKRANASNPKMLPGIVARLGLDGTAPQSLSNAAARTTASAERVRQITSQIEAVAQTWIWAPGLDHALDLADRGMTAEQFGQELVDRGLTTRPWHPLAVDSLARLCQRQTPVRMEDQLTDKMIVDVAAKLLNTKDIITLNELAAALDDASLSASPERIKTVVASSRRLLAAWPWITFTSSSGRVARVHRTAQGMLSVAGQLSPETLRAGLARRRAGKMLNDALPEPQALQALLAADPGYIVKVRKRGASIRLRTPLTPDQIYSRDSCAYRIITHLQATPEQTATRQELSQLAIDSGFTKHSATQTLSMHEAFISRRPNEWSLVSDVPVPAHHAYPHEPGGRSSAGALTPGDVIQPPPWFSEWCTKLVRRMGADEAHAPR